MFLLLDPVAEIRVREGREQSPTRTAGRSELVVVDQGVEAILAAIPDVPDKRPMVKQHAVFFEEALSQPEIQVAVGLDAAGAQQGQQPVRRRSFATHGRDANNTILVGELEVFVAPLREFERPFAKVHLVVVFHRPAIPQQPRNTHLERRRRLLWPAVKDPLRGVVTFRFR